MSGYFDCLEDVLPEHVIDAMHEACNRATHKGGGRPGEPVAMAGVRALVSLMTLTADIEARDITLAEHRRALNKAIGESHAARLRELVAERDALTRQLLRAGITPENEKTPAYVAGVDCGVLTTEHHSAHLAVDAPRRAFRPSPGL